MLINYQDSRPIYEQIVDRYRHLILMGALAPDEQMPSVRSLAMELSTNPNTVQKAYAELGRQDYLYSVKGRGSFVCHADDLRRAKVTEIADEIASLLREGEEIGADPEDILEKARRRLREG